MTIKIIVRSSEEVEELYGKIENDTKTIICTLDIGKNEYRVPIAKETPLYNEVVKQIIELERVRRTKDLEEFNKKHLQPYPIEKVNID